MKFGWIERLAIIFTFIIAFSSIVGIMGLDFPAPARAFGVLGVVLILLVGVWAVYAEKNRALKEAILKNLSEHTHSSTQHAEKFHSPTYVLGYESAMMDIQTWIRKERRDC